MNSGFSGTRDIIGSISAAFSSPVFVPPREERGGRSAGFLPEQRQVIEPRGRLGILGCSCYGSVRN